MPRTRSLASVVDVPRSSINFAISALVSSYFSTASILTSSAGTHRATVVTLVHFLMQVENPHTNHPTPSRFESEQLWDVCGDLAIAQVVGRHAVNLR